MTGIDQRAAFVVSHPAHLLTVLGMVLRWRPSILMLVEAPTGPGAGQEDLVREGLELAGLDNQCDALRFDEDESCRRALAGDHGFHLELGARIQDWLEEVNPDVVFGMPTRPPISSTISDDSSSTKPSVSTTASHPAATSNSPSRLDFPEMEMNSVSGSSRPDPGKRSP